MLKKIILILVLFFSFFWGINNTFADKADYANWNIKIDNLEEDKNHVLRWNDYFEKMILDNDKTAWKYWREWIDRFFGNISKSMKNIFYLIAWLYLIISVLQLFFSSNTEEEVTKFKKSIIWVSIWLMLMQIASSFVYVMFDGDFDELLAVNLSITIIEPFIQLIRFLAAFLFVAIAIYSFFTLVTANWDEERIKKWRYSIFQAIVWFFMLKITELLVTNSYWKILCWLWWKPSMSDNSGNTWNQCIWAPKFEANGKLIIDIINWINWFVAILTILFIIWAWVIILFSNWEEEKVKKAKWIIIYVIIWIFVLALSFLILNFLPEAQRLGLI